MNKPITIRVRTAMSSPAKVTGAAGDLMKGNADASKPLIGQRSVSDVLSSGNSSLISGASGVSGTSGGGVERADLTVAPSSTNTGSKTIGEAFQSNLAQRIDKQGELGRARREARRNKRAGIPESTAPSAEKAARDARVDNIISNNTSSSSLNNTMPVADFSGMGSDAPGKPTPSAKADAAPSAKSIRQAGRAERAQVRQDNKSAKQAAKIAGKNLKNTDRIFGKNNVEVTAAKPKSKRQVERDIKNTTLSTSSLLQGRSNEDSDTEANNFNPGFKNVKKSGVMSVPVNNVGPTQAPAKPSAPSVDASKLPDTSKLGSSTGSYTENRSNSGSGKTTIKATPKKSSSSFNSTMEAFNSGSRIADGTPTREKNGSVVSAAQMRMNANVGIKSKSPMKKGYFKKM